MDPILIPLALILGGFALSTFTVHHWFKHRARDQGVSEKELEAVVASLHEALERSEAERERLTRRMENVEAIVASDERHPLREGAEQGALGEAATPREATEAQPGA